MKRSIVFAAVCLMSGFVMAQTNQPSPQIYNESIQIKSDNNKIVAVVDTTGKVTLGLRSSSGASNWDGMIAHAAYWNGALLTAVDAIAIRVTGNGGGGRPEALSFRRRESVRRYLVHSELSVAVSDIVKSLRLRSCL